MKQFLNVRLKDDGERDKLLVSALRLNEAT
jgi:hypothetical protein